MKSLSLVTLYRNKEKDPLNTFYEEWNAFQRYVNLPQHMWEEYTKLQAKCVMKSIPPKYRKTHTLALARLINYNVCYCLSSNDVIVCFLYMYSWIIG